MIIKVLIMKCHKVAHVALVGIYDAARSRGRCKLSTEPDLIAAKQ